MSSVCKNTSALPIPGRRNSTDVSRIASSMLFPTGSYIGSVISARSQGSEVYRKRSSLSLHFPPSKQIEKKLNRTRKMSEDIRSVDPAKAKVARMTKIPTEGSQISLEWARQIVNQYLMKNDQEILAEGEKIQDFEVEDCKHCVGDFSATYKVSLRVRDQRPLTFIAKLLPADDTGRVYVFEANLMEKEIEMYFEVIPSLRQFLRGQKPADLSHLVDDCIPECIFGSHNMDGAGVLVLKSSLEDGFQHPMDPKGLNLSQMILVVETLANIHATGRALILKNSLEKVESRYPYLMQDMYCSGMLLVEVNQHLHTYQELLEAADDENTTEARKAFKRLMTYGAYSMLKGVRRKGPESLHTIIHGEVWEKNLLFREVDSKCMLLDWKNAKLATATLDLALLIFSSSSAELITEDTEQVLKAYHKAYCATLRQLTPRDDAKEPSFQDLKTDFATSAKDALLQAICMLVQEMQYLECCTVNVEDGEVDQEKAEKLRVYERRAINLLKAVDPDWLPEDEECEEELSEDGNSSFTLEDD